MTATKINARDITVEVQASDGTTWNEVLGLTSATLTPSANEETVDRTTFDSDGEYEGVIKQRGSQIKLDGRRYQDPDTGAFDPGQSRCETLATLKGLASLGKIRFSYPADTVWTEWTAFFSAGDQGGGNNDDVTWSITATKSGPSTTTAKA
ncbi:MAG TPA: hypothetical protein VIS06_21865 [Mycobacteriales bacterium]